MDSGLNLKALHKQDNKIGAILLSVSQAAIYKFNSSQEQWEKTNAEGSFFICRRSESPIYTFVVLNKLCRENFTEYITSNMEAVLQGQQYLLYRKGNDYIRAIWFSNNDECIKCEALMSKLICELNSRNMCCNVINTNKPSVSGKSDIVSMLNGAQNKQEVGILYYSFLLSDVEFQAKQP
uniref:Uncharacterized protein n=1 Tax=Romanomermis culicivorax TaxID=13658 RepID=A0A915JE65_ROMCU